MANDNLESSMSLRICDISSSTEPKFISPRRYPKNTTGRKEPWLRGILAFYFLHPCECRNRDWGMAGNSSAILLMSDSTPTHLSMWPRRNPQETRGSNVSQRTVSHFCRKDTSQLMPPSFAVQWSRFQDHRPDEPSRSKCLEGIG